MLPPAQPQHGQQAPPRQITSSPDTAAAGPSIVRVLEAGIRVKSEQWAVTCHVSRATCPDWSPPDEAGLLHAGAAHCALAEGGAVCDGPDDGRDR